MSWGQVDLSDLFKMTITDPERPCDNHLHCLGYAGT